MTEIWTVYPVAEDIPAGHEVERGPHGLQSRRDGGPGGIGRTLDDLDAGGQARASNLSGKVYSHDRLHFRGDGYSASISPKAIPTVLKEIRQKRYELGLEASDPVPTNPELCYNLAGKGFVRVESLDGLLLIADCNTSGVRVGTVVLDERTETFLWNVLLERRRARG